MRCVCGILGVQNFYPRPPRGGRLVVLHIHSHRKLISIHALREEGDGRGGVDGSGRLVFLSTPSARRATVPRVPPTPPVTISIHALREEGDG